MTEKNRQRVQILSEDGTGRGTQCRDAETGEDIPRIFRIELTLDMRDKDHPYWQGRLYTHAPRIAIVGGMEMLPSLCPYCGREFPQELVAFHKLQEDIQDAISKIGTIEDAELEEEGV